MGLPVSVCNRNRFFELNNILSDYQFLDSLFLSGLHERWMRVRTCSCMVSLDRKRYPDVKGTLGNHIGLGLKCVCLISITKKCTMDLFGN